MAHHLGRNLSTNHIDFNCALSPRPDSLPSHGLSSPFGTIEGLDHDDFREAAYEVFFTACRASPGSSGRGVTYNYTDEGSGNGARSPEKSPGAGMELNSRVKRALGLKMLRWPSWRRTSSFGGCPSSPIGSESWCATLPAPSARLRRPMTAVEIMRRQMRATEQNDTRLRKTLMRTLVGQIGRRAETIILPLKLLRHLNPSEFNDAQEYHQWQKRQLKILKAGLLIHPFIPLDQSDSSASKLREIIEAAEIKTIDTGKNSETMRALCNCVFSLAWQSPDSGPTGVCHWADGYPLNVELYLSLLHSIFDMEDESLVLDEVDEMLELIKKTWSMLGMNRPMHNLCFAWKLFQQYVVTNQVEADLLGASTAMLTEVANDAKKEDREDAYVKMLTSVLSAMKKWCDTRLLDYHAYFGRETVGHIERLLPLVLSVIRILEDDVPSYLPSYPREIKDDENKVDRYIRSSAKNAFAKMAEVHKIEAQNDSETLIQLAKETEQLALKERDIFSPVLKAWHPVAGGVAAVTQHACYRTLLNQYLTGISDLTNETLLVLQTVEKLEKTLIQMAVEDSVEYEDGGKAIIREMSPYDVKSVIHKLLREWVEKVLTMGKENLHRAKETETWKPTSKIEPYAKSAAEIIQFAKESIETLFRIPVSIPEFLVSEISDGFEHILEDYVSFVASCGSKQSYLPTLPPLTRCSHNSSRILKLWKIAACSSGVDHPDPIALMDDETNIRPSMSRETQRLYIRLNTLRFVFMQLQYLDKALSLSAKVSTSPPSSNNRKQSHFDRTQEALQAATQQVSEVAAYRLIFLDSNSDIYGGLYVGEVATARIKPVLRMLKQNITLLCAIVTDRTQLIALKEVMKAIFEAYARVLLAGGGSRNFGRLDHQMIEEDLEGLKQLFRTLIGVDEVERESEAIDGVVAMMGEPTEQLVEEFSILAAPCGTNRTRVAGVAGQKLSIPPTTGRWNRSDPNTILRVLCHRNERMANQFLKRTFQMAKRGHVNVV